MAEWDLTVVVPVLNESARIPALCRHLEALPCPSIVVDGGSTDGTLRELASAAGRRTRLERCATGRARQMNHGALLAVTDGLLFLHADTTLPEDGVALACRALANSESPWGRFDVSFDERSAAMNTIAWFMNQRSVLTGICTGDQAIFTTARSFHEAGRFPDIPLMEDIALSRKLREYGAPVRIRSPVVTASRRWRNDGLLRTVATMWWLRLLYAIGVSPHHLAARYRDAR